MYKHVLSTLEKDIRIFALIVEKDCLPATPLDTINSITPIVPSVIKFDMPPNATTGARQEKYRNKDAPIVLFLIPEVK